MESRDSASSSPPPITAVSRDVSSSCYVNRTNSVTASLANDATQLFHSRKYSECIDVLRQLLQDKQEDPKVLHNIAIAEYFRDGCLDLKKLLEVLIDVKIRIEKLAQASEEQAGATGNKNVSASEASGTLSSQNSVANNVSTVNADEFDTSVASLNIAVILFHLHEYKKAMSVLEPLYQNIGAMDETIAFNICLLLLDAALISYDASKSSDIITYLEKYFNDRFTSNQRDNGSIGQQQQSSNTTSKHSYLQAAIDASISDSTSGINAPEKPLSRTSSEETIDCQTVLSSPSSSSDILKSLCDRTIPGIDLKLKLQLYKVQFLLLTRNLKTAKRELKETMNMARGKDSSMALLLKSQFEYASGNYHKAIKVLMASNTQTELGNSIILNNNFGCIYYQLEKYHTSNLLLSKSLTSSSMLKKETPRKLSTFSQDKSLFIVYNCGVQYLACGKPVLAARCFQKARSVFYNRPLLWVRIAECCVMALEKKRLNGTEIRVNVIGKGKWRQLVVENGFSKNQKNSENDDNLSLTLARQCLVNALHLLKVSTSKVNSNGDSKEQKGGTSLHDLLTNSISEYEELCRKENHLIEQVVLANLSYIELELENPLKALSYASTLRNILDCSRIHAFLGHVYAAEALCLLNQPKEASEHLSIYLFGENKLELPHQEEDYKIGKSAENEDINVNSPTVKSVSLLTPEEARGTLYANLAATSAARGDLEQASKFVTEALILLPKSTEAVITAVYIDMRLGKTQGALAKLKQCTQVRFLKPNLTC